MALPRVQLPTLRAFLGSLGLVKTTTTSANRGLASLQGANGAEPMTTSDAAVRDVVNALVTAVDSIGVAGKTIVHVTGLGISVDPLTWIHLAAYSQVVVADVTSLPALLVLDASSPVGTEITVKQTQTANAWIAKLVSFTELIDGVDYYEPSTTWAAYTVVKVSAGHWVVTSKF